MQYYHCQGKSYQAKSNNCFIVYFTPDACQNNVFFMPTQCQFYLQKRCLAQQDPRLDTVGHRNMHSGERKNRFIFGIIYIVGSTCR